MTKPTWTGKSKLLMIDGVETETNPILCGREDCETLVDEGTDPAKLISQACCHEADEALINALGRGWVLKLAMADDSVVLTEESWEMYGLPWCKAYNRAFSDRAVELALGTEH